jgi:magnesium transporter
LFVGLALALAFFPLGWWRWGDSNMVVAVALAILAACATASAVALTLPWLLNRYGIDPRSAAARWQRCSRICFR